MEVFLATPPHPVPSGLPLIHSWCRQPGSLQMFGPSPTILCYHPRWQMLVGVAVQKPPTHQRWMAPDYSEHGTAKPGTRAALPSSSAQSERKATGHAWMGASRPALLSSAGHPPLRSKRGAPLSWNSGGGPRSSRPRKEAGGGEERGWRKRCQARRPRRGGPNPRLVTRQGRTGAYEAAA